MACEKCTPYGGLWRETPNGLARCDCEAGRKLSQKPVVQPPVLTAEESYLLVEELAGALPYFPGETGARICIARELRSICGDFDTGIWLVTRMARLYSRWPGLAELRRVYAGRLVPLDGVPAIGISEVYPEGIPSEHPAPAPPLLPAGTISADRQLEAAILELAEAKSIDCAQSINRPRPPAPIVAETPAQKYFRPITQADIDQAAAAVRRQRALDRPRQHPAAC